MNKSELSIKLKNFEKNGKTPEQLNEIRTLIFDSLDNGDIKETTKNTLLKDLYMTADLKGIFYIRVSERVKGLPKTEDEVEDPSYEESYEESYESSYDDE